MKNELEEDTNQSFTISSLIKIQPFLLAIWRN